MLIPVPRMVDDEIEETFSPERYYQMKELHPMSEQMKETVLLGLSQGDYERVASALLVDLASGQSAVSERPVERSARALEEFSGSVA